MKVPACTWHSQWYTSIGDGYADDKGIQHRGERLSGWQRVWQHETDHLDGISYSNRQSGIDVGGPTVHTITSRSDGDKTLKPIVQNDAKSSAILLKVSISTCR